jgi:hypothetical protein
LPNYYKHQVDTATEEVVREEAKWTQQWRRWLGMRRGVDMAAAEVVREAAEWTRRQRRSREEDFVR